MSKFRHETPEGAKRPEMFVLAERAALAEELRERTALRYMGDCKCGKCQLVPRDLIDRAIISLNGGDL